MKKDAFLISEKRPIEKDHLSIMEQILALWNPRNSMSEILQAFHLHYQTPDRAISNAPMNQVNILIIFDIYTIYSSFIQQSGPIVE